MQLLLVFGQKSADDNLWASNRALELPSVLMAALYLYLRHPGVKQDEYPYSYGYSQLLEYSAFVPIKPVS